MKDEVTNVIIVMHCEDANQIILKSDRSECCGPAEGSSPSRRVRWPRKCWRNAPRPMLQWDSHDGITHEVVLLKLVNLKEKHPAFLPLCFETSSLYAVLQYNRTTIQEGWRCFKAIYKVKEESPDNSLAAVDRSVSTGQGWKLDCNIRFSCADIFLHRIVLYSSLLAWTPAGEKTDLNNIAWKHILPNSGVLQSRN